MEAAGAAVRLAAAGSAEWAAAAGVSVGWKPVAGDMDSHHDRPEMATRQLTVAGAATAVDTAVPALPWALP